MSYLDAFVLQAALPVPCSYITKAELAANPFVRLAISRLGAILVERSDKKQGLEDAKQISKIAARGQVFLFFPEGTFQRIPGLLPFRMGAFLTSVEAGIPMVPVTILGTRSKLRSDSWFPRRGHVSVVIEKPVLPTGEDWPAALRLREEVRRVILNHLGEPDLADSFHTFSETVTSQPEKQNFPDKE
jgi:1-acyl-sn-glycerol-3-phosphate acyltransferase